ncbi:MAG TPA: hypothetical protein VJ697_06920 [Nitrososphaeraceae archaeon]|nr:hypothetical protein [Nitrososphaeraceae archaeon]
MALSILSKKPSIKNILKLIFSGLSISFIAMLVIMLAHDTITGTSSQTAEYCSKYGILASPACW